jgi:hypothetical protein
MMDEPHNDFAKIDWIRNYKSPEMFGSTPDSEPDFIKDLIKAFRNKLRVNRIQKIVRIFKIDI